MLLQKIILVKKLGSKAVVCAWEGGANTTSFLAAHFAKRNTKNCSGEKRNGESEGGQKFPACRQAGFLPTPFLFARPTCPAEVLTQAERNFLEIVGGIFLKMSSNFF